MSSEKDVIFIDWDGTLSHSRFWEQWQDNNLDTEKYSSISKQLFSEDKTVVQAWMRGILSSEDVAAKIQPYIGASDQEIISALRISCENMIINNVLLEKIQILRQLGKNIVIATDNMDTFTRWTVTSLELDDKFDGILSSSDLGIFKKEQGFFERALDLYDVLPNKAVLIDDSVDNRVVEELGMEFRKVGPTTTAQHLDEIMATIVHK